MPRLPISNLATQFIDRMLRYDWRRWALILLATIYTLGLAGAVAVLQPSPYGWLFDLDQEKNVPTAFSGLLLMACAGLTGLLARRGLLRRSAWALACLFLAMAIDEIVRIHERVERLTGLDWQIVYLPLLVLAAAGWLQVLQQLRVVRWSAVLWIAGAAAWTTSQLLEAAAWGWWGIWPDQQAAGFAYFVLIEEKLEMTGSSLFLLALLAYCQYSSLRAAAARSCKVRASKGAAVSS